MGCQQNMPFEHDALVNSVFGPAEQVEYVNSLLVIHFQLTRQLIADERWFSDLVFVDDQCRARVFAGMGELLRSHPSVSHISLRFDTPTHWQFWDDDTNTAFTCGTCYGSIPALGDFFKIRSTHLVIYYDTTLGQITSSAHTIKENPAPAPVKTTTLDVPSGCPTMTIAGGITDPYEHAEYVNGLLQIHFRHDPINSGNYRAEIFKYDSACGNPSIASGQNTELPGYMEYYSARFDSPTHFQLWNDDTEAMFTCSVGSECGGSITPATFVSLRLSGYANGWTPDPNHSFTSTAFRIQEPGLDPVIVIPGIMGSWPKNGQWVIEPVLHTYDNLISNLAGNGYEQGKTLFTFPYEWRDSNIVTAHLLKQKIADVKTICQCAKVDLVAHSMGGLVARQYIQSDEYQHDVDQLVFLGTPQLGSIDSYLTWEAGELHPSLNSFLFKKFFSLEALEHGYLSLFSYIRGRPMISIQELLPIFDYLQDNKTGILRTYPTNYPRNIFLENLQANVQKLYASGVRITNIVSDHGASSTIIKLDVVDSPYPGLWQDGFPKNFTGLFGGSGLIKGHGDDVVLLTSAEGIIVPDTHVLAVDHHDIPTNGEELVIGTLNPGHPIVLLDRGVIGNMLFVKILSPVDVQIIAPDGKRIGKDFATNQEINDIPDAFYSGFLTDDEYLTIPNPLDGEYKIITQGTGTGAYTVATGYITEKADGTATSAESDYVGTTTPGVIQQLQVTIDSAKPDIITVKPTDTTKPTIAIQSPTAKDYLRSEQLPITVTATDDSGIASQSIVFDVKKILNNVTVDLFYEKLGAHAVKARASDPFGNTASRSVSFQITATYDSAISDVNRAFTLRWIKKKSFKNDIIEEINDAKEKKKESQSDRILTKLLAELKKKQAKELTPQGYLLLKEDIEWVRGHN